MAKTIKTEAERERDQFGPSRSRKDLERRYGKRSPAKKSPEAATVDADQRLTMVVP